MSYVFGPVPSRRLGRSLGVDVVPFKHCTYDCIYCQLGRTTCKTIERKEWVPLEGVLDEVQSKLDKRPDYITLSGSGEPTLFSRIGELIDGIKRITDTPVALLTNGSLLWQPDVRDAIKEVDLLIPSLDAGDETRYRHINRPHDAISFDQLIEGLIASREACRGQYWLEVFLLAGYTDIKTEARKITRYVNLIKPHRTQLNTTTRPPAESYAEGVSPERMAAFAALFDPPAEVIADYHHVYEQPQFAADKDEILNLLRRRPCSIDGIARGLNMHPNEVVKHLDTLQADKQVKTTWRSGTCYYEAVHEDSVEKSSSEEPTSVIPELQDRLMARARGRTILRAVAGGRFCAVMLDDGNVGVANLCPEVCGEPSRQIAEALPKQGQPASIPLAALTSPEDSAIGLATANALANRPAVLLSSPRRTSSLEAQGLRVSLTEGDLLDALELRSDDHVGMIGCFSPLVDPIREHVRKLSIFERHSRLLPDLLPEEKACEILPECSIAIITATTLMNGTIDKLLAASAGCREIVLLGPSTPLLPEVFAKQPRHVTLLAGVIVTNAGQLLRTVEQNGGTRDFKPSALKVNLRIDRTGGSSHRENET